MRVAFAGTPEFAAAALEAIQAAGHEVVLVLTQPDRPAGRGLQLQPSAVKKSAMASGLAVAQPRSLRLDGRFPGDAASARQALAAARPDVMVVAAYGLILPQWVLDLPPHGCLNIHASLLPRWRGAAPIQRAIEAGDTEIGITIMQMDAGLDTGPMLQASRMAIRTDDTAGTLHDRLAALGAQAIVDALNALARGVSQAVPQPDEGVSYAHKIEKSQAPIDWRMDAGAIERRIRAFDPSPGATLSIGGDVVKVWRAAVRSGSGLPGAVLVSDATGLVVACGEGALELLELQRPGGRRISAAQFLQTGAGTALRPGARLDTQPD